MININLRHSSFKTYEIKEIVEKIFSFHGIDLPVPSRRTEIFSMVLSSPNFETLVKELNNEIKNKLKKLEKI